MTVQNIIDIAIAAGEITLGAKREKNILSKEGRANFVTEYDTRVQEFIIEKVRELVPDALFVCEENDTNDGYDNHSYRFVIDPIDGTTNFIRNAPEYAICIGVMKGDEHVCGVVHCPVLNITYFAEHGKGAFAIKNGAVSEIHVTQTGLDGAIIAAGTSPYLVELLDTTLGLTRHLLDRAADTRRSGSAAIDICRAAEGVCDIMFEFSNYAWDYTAASIILTEAGGKFCDLNGNKIRGDIQSSVLGGSPLAVDEFLQHKKLYDCKK